MIPYKDYDEYIRGVREGLDDAGIKDNNFKFLLYGPAGLFRNNQTHHLCWGIIDKCNANLSACPFDILSYHRKGMGEASDILNESLDLLLNNIYIKFPNLRIMKISNRFENNLTNFVTYKQHKKNFYVKFQRSRSDNRLVKTIAHEFGC